MESSGVNLLDSLALTSAHQPASGVRDASSPSIPCLQVLVIDEEPPFPLNSGKRIRTWNLLCRLAKRHQITFLCHRGDDQAAEKLESAGVKVVQVEALAPYRGLSLYARLLFNLFSPFPYSVAKHYTRRFRKELSNLLSTGDFDLLHCEWTPYARYLRSVGDIPSVVSAHNIESQIWQRRAERSPGMLSRMFFRMQAWKMQRFERSALSRCSSVTAVSDLDVQQFKAWGIHSAQSVENGVDIDFFSTPQTIAASPLEVLFVGSLDWFPNQDAVRFFVEEIFPLIKIQKPAAQLTVVGRRAPESLALWMRRQEGVTLLSEVPDVRPCYTRAALAIVPLRIGGGTRIKILEAMSMGKPVVSTSIGAEGLAVKDGTHVLIADTPAEFARAAVSLMLSEELCRKIGQNGRKLVLERYSWDRIACHQEQVWLAAASQESAAKQPAHAASH